MQIVVTPSEEIKRRAFAQDWGSEEDTDANFFLNGNRTAGLCKKVPFSPIYYLGTVTLPKHRIRAKFNYALTPIGPVFSGNLIKEALKILGKNRVRIFYHFRDEDREYCVILLGTKKGTIGIAPRVGLSPEEINGEKTKQLSSIWRKPTSKLVRGILFATL